MEGRLCDAVVMLRSDCFDSLGTEDMRIRPLGLRTGGGNGWGAPEEPSSDTASQDPRFGLLPWPDPHNKPSHTIHTPILPQFRAIRNQTRRHTEGRVKHTTKAASNHNKVQPNKRSRVINGGNSDGVEGINDGVEEINDGVEGINDGAEGTIDRSNR